jgi:DNA topoisomerase I
MRLRRAEVHRAGIRRVQRGNGFTYLGPDGTRVEGSVLERIQALAIPPAWTEVWICPFPNGHIQAIGIDAAGRRQYRYHDAWTKRRDAEKFARMIDFATSLPELRARVATHLRQPGLPKSRVLALGVRLLDLGMFRIGGEEYAAEHETYGLATLERRHVRIHGDEAHFDYTAKGGKRRQIVIIDRDLVDVLSRLKRRRGGGSCLLAWRDGRRWVDVSSHDLNAYIKQGSCGGFSAKDFGTWEATLLAAMLCAQAPASTRPRHNNVRSPASSEKWRRHWATPQPFAASPISIHEYSTISPPETPLRTSSKTPLCRSTCETGSFPRSKVRCFLYLPHQVPS